MFLQDRGPFGGFIRAFLGVHFFKIPLGSCVRGRMTGLSVSCFPVVGHSPLQLDFGQLTLAGHGSSLCSAVGLSPSEDFTLPSVTLPACLARTVWIFVLPPA